METTKPSQEPTVVNETNNSNFSEELVKIEDIENTFFKRVSMDGGETWLIVLGNHRLIPEAVKKEELPKTDNLDWKFLMNVVGVMIHKTMEELSELSKLDAVKKQFETPKKRK